MFISEREPGVYHNFSEWDGAAGVPAATKAAVVAKPVKRTLGKYQAKNGNWLQPARRLALYLRDGFTCAYCGVDMRDFAPADITLDHLVCRSTGNPDHSNENLVTCCRRCNSSRKDKPWRQYATGGAIARIMRQRRRKVNMELARAILKGTAGDPRLESRGWATAE